MVTATHQSAFLATFLSTEIGHKCKEPFSSPVFVVFPATLLLPSPQFSQHLEKAHLHEMQEENEAFVYPTVSLQENQSPLEFLAELTDLAGYDFPQHQGGLLFCSELVVEEIARLNFPSPTFVALLLSQSYCRQQKQRLLQRQCKEQCC